MDMKIQNIYIIGQNKWNEYQSNLMKNKMNKQLEQQKQSLIQSEQQEQAQIQYYIYQDLQNLINLIYSRKAVLEHFNNDLSNPMVVLSNNKILLQLNLSSGIHYDQQQQYSKNKSLSNFLIQERKKAFQILAQVIDNNDLQINKTNRFQNPLNQSLLKYKKNYENSQFRMNEFELQKTNLDSKFDENVLSKVISSMQTVDSQVNSIKDSYSVPDKNEILLKAQTYESIAKQKLNQNFPKGIQNGKTENGNGKNEFRKKVEIEEEEHQDNDYNKRKGELINFLLLQGYFNEEKIQYNCYNLVQQQFNEIKDLLITNSEQKVGILIAKNLYRNNNRLENHFTLFFFFKLFMEYSKQCNKINGNQQIEAFRNSIYTIKSYANYDQFFNYLEIVKSINLQQNLNLPEEEQINQLFQIFCSNQNGHYK